MTEFQEPKAEDGRSRGCLIFVIVALAACLTVVTGVGYVLYSIQTARDTSNEGFIAIGSLRTLNVAQTLYMEENGQFGSLADLERATLIDAVLASGEKRGYKIELVLVDQGQRYWIKASPIKPGKPHLRRFFTNQTGTMYYSLTNFKVDHKTCEPTTKLQPMN